jgi:YidC/Oxa1 family membrane protein insertase
MNSENRNFILAVILSMALVVVYNTFIEKPVVQKILPQTAEVSQKPVDVSAAVMTREEAIGQDQRVAINTPKLKGSINLLGGRFDDLELTQYQETIQKGSPHVVLLSPSNAHHGYLIECGWMGSNTHLFPNGSTLWKASSPQLSPQNPVTLSWQNSQGVLFEKTIEVDDNYLFTVKEKVTNHSKQDIDFFNWAVISRIGLPETSDYMVLHEGALGVINGKLKELTYKNLKGETVIEKEGSGWFGFTDKYWLTSLIPEDKSKVSIEFKSLNVGGRDVYQAQYTTVKNILKSGESSLITHRIFAGAKVVGILDEYEKTQKIDRFDLAVDFGWFYFLTKPLFYVMDILYHFLGNFGWAIVVLTVLTKLLMFPLANKSYHSMNRMKLLQPEMERLKEKYKDDQVKMQQELMAFYKDNKINPVGGCLPMIIQIPVFFALYKVLFVSIEMRHAPFFGWIHDLSAPDPTSLFNLFGLLPFDPPSFLMIGIWPIIMAGTMFLQQKMSPQPADPIQAKMMMLMPLFFLYLFASFPAGLVIYWAWSNILTVAQQWAQSKTMTEKGA